VVDVGDQKVSVSCVEDGISHPGTRIMIGFGGGDVTQVLHHLCQQNGFPYQDCDPKSAPDGLLLHKLKEETCHLELEEGSLLRHSFSSPGHSYSVYLGDERIVAPLALFQLELLEVTGPKGASVSTKDPGDAEDPHDQHYLRETSRKYTKTGEIQQGTEPGNQEADFEEVDLEGVNLGPNMRAEVLPLDQAIVRSIENCTGEEMKKKMYAAILVVGGGFRFPGAAKYLQSRILASLGSPTQLVEVIIDAKDFESDTTVWRGAAVMANMESAQELWLRPREWSKHGQKLLRERAPFPWE